MNLTVGTVLRETARFFAKRGLEASRLEAELLMAHLLATDRLRLYIDGDRPLTTTEISAYKDLIRQRLSGQPLAYITKKKSFLNWEFQITPDVLVPPAGDGNSGRKGGGVLSPLGGGTPLGTGDR